MSSTSQGRPWDVHRLPSAEGRIFLVTEPDRRLRAVGSTVLSVMAHPGGALDFLTRPARR